MNLIDKQEAIRLVHGVLYEMMVESAATNIEQPMSEQDKLLLKVNKAVCNKLREMPSAQPERKIFEEMSDIEFEKWLYEHGICNPDIHESISCSIVPLLIDNAINELSPQPEIIRCKDCKHQEKFFHTDGRRKGGGYYIYGCDFAEGYSHVCLDDDFCSRAERRQDEQK